MTENQALANDMARVNVTWNGNNGDLPDPVSNDASDADIRQFLTEAVRSGSVPGIPADPNASFDEFVIERFKPSDVRPFNYIMGRPKTPFGLEFEWDGEIKPSHSNQPYERRRNTQKVFFPTNRIGTICNNSCFNTTRVIYRVKIL